MSKRTTDDPTLEDEDLDLDATSAEELSAGGEEAEEDDSWLGDADPMGIPALQGNSDLGRMYRTWYLDYASYVILERAVPHIDDGLKPVQRRILHNMRVEDTGRLSKVQNFVGTTMRYHPHGDASIYDALVNLGQKGLLIDMQGNWGNIFTGASAAAGRYIEAKLSDFALEAVFGEHITEWKKNYDGSLDEPVALPIRFPLLLAQGAEGIAVGLSSKILSHNFVEIAEACIAHLKGKPFELYPDFPTGGFVDVSRYSDGARGGRILSRAKIEKVDSRTLAITELPAGQTTHKLIENILKVADQGKIRIKRIDDMSAEEANIRISLPAGVSSDNTMEALFAFTDCQVSLSPNCCVIKDDKPLFTTISELLIYNVERTKHLFALELGHRLSEREGQYFYASLERLFIEERIYKDKTFEQAKTEAEALAHVHERLKPFAPQLLRPITPDDLKRLLEIRMARILRFNLARHEEQMLRWQEEIDTIRHDLQHIDAYAIRWYEYLIRRYGDDYPRRTKITSISSVKASKVVELDKKLYIQRKEGFIGTALKDAELVGPCSSMDDIILFYRSGQYQIVKVEDKRFVGNMGEVIHIARFVKGDDRTIYNVVYRDGASGNSYIKRFALTALVRERVYDLTRGTKHSEVLYFSANGNGEAEKISVSLMVKSKMQRRFSFERDFSEVPIKGKGVVGLLVTKAEVKGIKLFSKGFSTLGGREVWFDRDVMRINYNGQGELLGEFLPEDRVLVILESGECYTTDFSDTNHFEDNILRIEKLDERKLWTLVYWDDEQGYHYIKRFAIRADQKREQMLGDNPKNQRILLSDTYFMRLAIAKDASPEEDKIQEIDVESFATVKSVRALGRRLARYPLGYIQELEPLKPSPYEVEEDMGEEDPDGGADSVDDAPDLFAGS